MKSVIFVVIVGLALSNPYDLKRHAEIVEKVNRLKTTWTAKLYDDGFKPYFGVKKMPVDAQRPRKTFRPRNDIPEEYDLRKAHPECETITEIRDQSNCGACWAFAAVEAMSDRLCIHSQGRIQTRVSAKNVVTCCTWCGNGCLGGSPGAAFDYWIENGIPSGGLYGDKESCQPYFLPECDDHMHQCQDYESTPDCETQCQAGYPISYQEDKSYGVDSYSVWGESDIKQEIFENGSVSATFTVYEDLADYHSGIYQHVYGWPEGGHAVKIIGWGAENGTKYWIIANSWNPRWGESGYFRMIRGVDECGIESGVDAGMPRIK